MPLLLLRRVQFALIWTLGLWFVYRAVMWLKRRREAIKARGRAVYYLVYAFVAIALVLDVAYNVVVGTVLFADPPRELTFTARLKGAAVSLISYSGSRSRAGRRRGRVAYRWASM